MKLFSKKLLMDGEEEEEEGAPQSEEDHGEVAEWEGGGEEGETEEPCDTPVFKNLRHLQRVQTVTYLCWSSHFEFMQIN